MKKLFLYLILAAGSSAAYAQQDAAAKTILNDVSKQYRSYNSVKADFVINVQIPQEKVNQSQSGTLLTQAKTNKYKLDIYMPQSKVLERQIYSDGKSQWTYLPQQKEVQVNDASSSAEGMNPAQIFTVYEKGYKYIFSGLQSKGGKTYQAIELTPTDAKQSIFKIKLLIDKAKKQIYSAQLFDKNGSRYTYTVNSFTPNAPAAADAFTFNPKKYPGVEVVDLR
ncbi:outer membrane lipoprotein carrier protein LolA [Mucilaginibacter daejeonensis]|uniref:LolA family protein n=1 Tax=Mucilaginibacter daejeonensis TaxID=398049 RepID=UPI001D175A65|nr:outer membrane lipoprotein carrier protein LolA [Mucilaginibacter daejeonensis]UEG52217.1 outer membrane lipoprotein carrier protein LolA [Mucilaginibacter daejeonensis]